jgi:hypothetical protein
MKPETLGVITKGGLNTVSTAILDEVEQQIEQAEVELQPQTIIREFCPVCFTDQVSVLTGGMIYCPDCGNTSDPDAARN